MANKRPKGISVYLIMLASLMLIAMFMFSMNNSSVSIQYPQVLRLFDEHRVSRYSLDFTNGEMELAVKIKPSEMQSMLGQNAAGLTVGNSNEQALAGGLFGMFGSGGTNNPQRPGGSAPDAEQEMTLSYRLPSITLFLEHVDPVQYEKEYNELNPDNPLVWNWTPPKGESLFTLLLPTLLIIGVMMVFYWLMMRQAGGGGKMMSFSKAKVKSPDDSRKVTFDDVAGADEEKAELVEIVEFLKNPSKFNMLGARIPKGVLLMGPPGTGKTLLARAVAGEAGVPFFSISGSDFVEMFVGVGASRVRDLFDNAKKNAPSIVFIDEIDAVGRHRGAGLGGGHDEREQTLNQLLVEMDGFGANSGVIIIAATNRRDILDPALLRPGRFDRQIVVGYPDVKGREEILRVHTRGKPIGPDVDLRTIAKTTVGFTGADLENLVNEAALMAARSSRKAITMEDIEMATIKVVAGPEKRSHVVSEKDKRLTAFHEAGHAVTTYYCETQKKVHEVSIIPRGMAGGYTMSLPEEDTSYNTKHEMEEEIVTLLAGRMAEKLVLDDISTGASNDIERATKIARAMVTRYGFSERLGPIVYGQDEEEVFLGMDINHTRNYSETVAAEIDEEIRAIIDTAYDKAEEILTEHRDQLDRVANFLFEYEKVDAEGFEKLMKGDESVYGEYEQKLKEREEQERRRKKEQEEQARQREQRRREEEELRRQRESINGAPGNAYVEYPPKPEPPRDPKSPPPADEMYPPVRKEMPKENPSQDESVKPEPPVDEKRDDGTDNK